MSDKSHMEQSGGTDRKEKQSGGIPPAEPVILADMVEYATGAVVSRTIKKSKEGTLTVFAFDEGEELSTHSAPFDAYVQILDGEVEITVGDEVVRPSIGDTVLMPADIPHGLHAITPFKMLLIMIRGQ
ncbi:cupin domain-containing protein [Gemmatimonadota bacterium]